MKCPKCDKEMELRHSTYQCRPCNGLREDGRLSDAPNCRMEVEIHEDRRRYVTIEVSQETRDRICEWTMKYKPTASEQQAAIDAVKGAKVIKEELIQDTYEIYGVDFPSHSQ